MTEAAMRSAFTARSFIEGDSRSPWILREKAFRRARVGAPILDERRKAGSDGPVALPAKPGNILAHDKDSASELRGDQPDRLGSAHSLPFIPAGAAMQTLTVELGDRSYPICIGAGILEGLGSRLPGITKGRRAAVITNPVVAKLYRDRVVESLQQAGIETVVIEVPDGEEHKNLAWLTFLFDRLLDARLDRESAIIALGGGVIGDLAGFTAATFLRGVPLVQVPTTLLAQVDSSVGGKTAVNHPAGKNLIGAFYQPRLVWADVRTLQTLPGRELRAGMAEVIKYGATLSAPLFELLEEHLESVLELEEEQLVDVVRQCCALKAQVVAQDETESGFRAVLNFGHTAGHAIEMLTEYRQYLHGEAVAAGMAFAARLSSARGFCTPQAAKRVIRLLERAGLPIDVPRELLGQPLAVAMETDKKAAGGKIKFVCLEEIGKARFELLTAEEIVAGVEPGNG
jgi:3-dehydroquinate synthase